MPIQILRIRHVKIMLLCAAALACSLGVSVAAYFTTSTSTYNKVPAHTATAAKAPATMQATITALQRAIASKPTHLQPAALTAQTNGYQLPGSNVAILLPQTYAAAYAAPQNTDEQTTYDELSAALPIISTTLAGNGFSEQTQAGSSAGLSANTYTYKRADAVCQVTVLTQLTAVCSLLALLKSIASQAAPMLAEYQAAAPDLGLATITAPTIQASKTPGFTTAVLKIFNQAGETDAHFYEQASNGWHLVNLNWYNDPHQDDDIIPNCEGFESDASVRQAFLGQQCYDSLRRNIATIQ